MKFPFLTLLIFSGRFQSQLSCPYQEDYLPCRCMQFTNRKYEIGIHCDYKFIETVPAIFGSTTAFGLDELWITTNEDIDTFALSKDILAKHWITGLIHLGPCYNAKKKPFIQVDPDAFRLSHNSAKALCINTFDMLGFNFSFMENMNQLEKLDLLSCSNVHSLNFPLLPKLRNLRIWWLNNGLKDWSFLQPIFSTGLELLYLKDSSMGDDDVNQVLELLLKGPTKDTLKNLDLGKNSLTRIPGQLKYLSNLSDFRISYQNKPGFNVLSDPIRLADNPINNSYFDLSASHISHIEPGILHSGLIIEIIYISIRTFCDIKIYHLY